MSPKASWVSGRPISLKQCTMSKRYLSRLPLQEEQVRVSLDANFTTGEGFQQKKTRPASKKTCPLLCGVGCEKKNMDRKDWLAFVRVSSMHIRMCCTRTRFMRNLCIDRTY